MAGRPPYEPTSQERQIVQVLRANGISERMIAENLHINVRTMRRAFRRELARGKEQVVAALGASVIRAGLQGDWRAALSWLARFGGPEWQEVQRRDVRTFDASQEDLSQLSDEEIDRRLAEVRRKQALARGEPVPPPKPDGTVH